MFPHLSTNVLKLYQKIFFIPDIDRFLTPFFRFRKWRDLGGTNILSEYRACFEAAAEKRGSCERRPWQIIGDYRGRRRRRRRGRTDGRTHRGPFPVKSIGHFQFSYQFLWFETLRVWNYHHKYNLVQGFKWWCQISPKNLFRTSNRDPMSQFSVVWEATVLKITPQV